MLRLRVCSLIAMSLAAVLPACTDVPTVASSQALESVALAFNGAEWSTPVNLGAPINSPANEQNAVLSKDELTLFFTSDRPGGHGGLDIWVARRASLESPWETPVNLGSPVNSSTNDFAPYLSGDGHLLFFASNRPGGHGNNDIYLARRANPNDDFGWGQPINLGSDVNTTDAENAPVYLQNAETGAANFYFNRGTLPALQADIYSASVTRNGETRGPAVLVAELSVSGANDAAPTLRHDGKEVYFWSSRPGSLGSTDLWMATRRNAKDTWSTPVNAGAPLNSSSNEVTPSLSFDGRALIFASGRPGGLGSNDLWVVGRTPSGNTR